MPISKTVAVIGQGYVGLPLSMAAFDSGWTVLGIDNLDAKVDQINLGISPIEDVTDAKLKLALSTSSYRATTDFSLVSSASVIVICVPTPLDENLEPDLSFLQNAITSLSRYVANGTLIISESTSYPGTLNEFIIPLFDSLKSNACEDVYFAVAPERVNPGDAIWNLKNIPRLVGGINNESKTRAVDFYNSICDVVVTVSTPEVAEAAKLLENTYRLVNIAMVNEFAQLCSKAKLNTSEIIAAASTKPYGFTAFWPGVGVGGHCIPVDPMYLTSWAKRYGGKTELIELANSINQFMPKFVAERALSIISKKVKNPKILILGVAYKPGTGDTRNTPTSELRKHLEANGAIVAWNDPFVKVWEGTVPVDLEWPYDLAILTIKQPNLNLDKLFLTEKYILDCTNTLSGSPRVVSL